MSADLFKKTVKFLDPHLALLVIEYFEEQKFLDAKLVAKEKAALLAKTQMYDYAIPEFKKLPQLDASFAKDVDRLVESMV